MRELLPIVDPFFTAVGYAVITYFAFLIAAAVIKAVVSVFITGTDEEDMQDHAKRAMIFGAITAFIVLIFTMIRLY